MQDATSFLVAPNHCTSNPFTRNSNASLLEIEGQLNSARRFDLDLTLGAC